jgi:hypothetical protein
MEINSKVSHENKIRNQEKFGRRALTLIVLLILIVFLMQVMVSNVIAEPVMYDHHVMMIQGDDPQTMEDEPDNHMYTRERFFFFIPWNESFIEVPIPKGAKSISIDQIVYNDFMGWIPGEHSTYWNPGNPPHKHFKDMENMACCIANAYEWGFPAGADRNLTLSIHLETGSDYNQSMDGVRSDDVWNFSSGLKLKNGEVSGDYVSLMTKMGVNIPKVEMNWNVTASQDNFTVHISNNNGTDWLDFKEHNGEKVNFTIQGNELVWKINMTQDIKQNNTPVVIDLQINATYTQMYSDIILQLDYALERENDPNKFEFTMDLYKDYGDDVTPIFLIYTNKGYTLESNDIPITLHDSQTEFPDKNAYIFMGGSFSPEATITIQDVEEGEFPWLLLWIILIVVICLVVILVARSLRKDAKVYTEIQETNGKEEQKEKLLKKKEGLQLAIKKLDDDFKEGLLDEDIYQELKGGYENKVTDINGQIDALGSGAEGEGVLSSEREALISKKDNMLKSIKKLDHEYEDGLLDEEVYKELRAGYKRKAVDLMKELDEK